jgi:hypothetical protein
MKARAAIVSSAALLAIPTFALPATAQPPGVGLETFSATCDGQPVTVTLGGQGASFWLDGQHYLLTSLAITFGPETFTKTFGQRTGLTDSTITCEGTIVEPEGTGTFHVTAVAVP